MATYPPTVSHVFERAAALTDPDDHDDVVTGLVARTEDDDRPASAVEDFEEFAFELLGREDAEGDSPAGQMTAAAAVWLAAHPEQDHDREHVLREAARSVWHGDPPESVARWLSEGGIEHVR